MWICAIWTFYSQCHIGDSLCKPCRTSEKSCNSCNQKDALVCSSTSNNWCGGSILYEVISRQEKNNLMLVQEHTSWHWMLACLQLCLRLSILLCCMAPRESILLIIRSCFLSSGLKKMHSLYIPQVRLMMKIIQEENATVRWTIFSFISQRSPVAALLWSLYDSCLQTSQNTTQGRETMCSSTKSILQKEVALSHQQ